MKFCHFLRRGLALLLLLATLISAIPFVAASADENGIPWELRGKDLVASFDENGNLVYEEADARIRGAMRASSFNEQADQDFSQKQRVAFFVDRENSEENAGFNVDQDGTEATFSFNSSTGTNITNLINRGVTDFFVITKKKSGSFSVTDLKNVIKHAGNSANVYAWMHCALDNSYIKANKNSAQYHFSVGRKCNAYDTSHSLYNSRNGYVDLGLSAYQTYFNGLVDQVEACDGVDGVLLDSVKWGADYYGWADDAKTKMGATAYNAAVDALAAHHGYVTKT